MLKNIQWLGRKEGKKEIHYYNSQPIYSIYFNNNDKHYYKCTQTPKENNYSYVIVTLK